MIHVGVLFPCPYDALMPFLVAVLKDEMQEEKALKALATDIPQTLCVEPLKIVSFGLLIHRWRNLQGVHCVII
jgi:hypothetical protein